MLESIPVCILVGTVLGFLSGLGIGGGSLLILWLTAVLEMPQRMAQGINLLFFLPAALVSILFSRNQGRLDGKRAASAALVGACSAAIFAWLSAGLDESLLRKLFGVMLLGIGLRELIRNRRRT